MLLCEACMLQRQLWKGFWQIPETSLAFDWWLCNVARASHFLIETTCLKKKAESNRSYGPSFRKTRRKSRSPAEESASLPSCAPETPQQRAKTSFSLLQQSFYPPPFLFSCFPNSHHFCSSRWQVPGGAGRGGWFGHAWARGPDVWIASHCGCGAQPGANTAMGEGARPAFTVSVLRLLALRGPVPFPAALQEVCKHLALAFHTDLSSTHKVVVVSNKAIDVLRHLEGEKRGLILVARKQNIFLCMELYKYYISTLKIINIKQHLSSKNTSKTVKQTVQWFFF